MAFNASDTRHLREAKKQAVATRDRDERVIHKIMSDPEGRAYLHDLLVYCSVFQTPFTGSAATTDFNCGMQSIGLKLIGEINQYASDQYIMMMREQSDKETANGRRYGSNGDGDGRSGDSPNNGRDTSTQPLGADGDYEPTADLRDETRDEA